LEKAACHEKEAVFLGKDLEERAAELIVSEREKERFGRRIEKDREEIKKTLVRIKDLGRVCSQAATQAEKVLSDSESEKKQLRKSGREDPRLEELTASIREKKRF